MQKLLLQEGEVIPDYLEEFSKGIRECHLYHSNHLISTIIIISTTSIGSPPCSAKGNIPIYLVGNFNHFNYLLSMISECVTKSSITADTAFRKIYPCRGVQLFAHTCQPTLNATSNLFLWRPADGGWLHSIHAHIYP